VAVTTHSAASANLVLLAPAAENVNAIAMAVTWVAVVSVHSLIRVWHGRHLARDFAVAMTLLAASSHVVQADRTAHCSEEAVAGFGQADTDSSSSILELVEANIAAAVSGPAAVRRQIAVVETSVGIAVFAETGPFAVEAAGSSAAVVVEAQTVVESCNSAATEPGSFAGYVAIVGLRRRVQPWVAAAASGRPRSTSAPARTPRIAHSRPVGRPRMEAA
jgi:hypothetical protein